MAGWHEGWQAGSGSGGWLADEIATGDFQHFKIHYYSLFTLFNKCTALLQLCQCVQVDFSA